MKHGKVSGKTIHYPQLRGSIAGVRFPAMAELKYDGELNYIRITKDDSYTINKYGTMRMDFPALNEIENNILFFEDINSATLVGEVYWNDGKLGALYDLLSHKKDDAINLCLFDIIELNGASQKLRPLVSRIETMYELGLAKWMPQRWVVEDAGDAQTIFHLASSAGWEGIVVKGLETTYITGPCTWAKIKFKDQSDYTVVYVDPTQERIEVAVPSPNGNPVVVGVKAPNKYKKHINMHDDVTIEHQGVLKSGSLRHPVLIPRKEWK